MKATIKHIERDVNRDLQKLKTFGFFIREHNTNEKYKANIKNIAMEFVLASTIYLGGCLDPCL